MTTHRPGSLRLLSNAAVRTAFFATAFLALGAAYVTAATHYVNATNSTPAAPYINWSTAARRIQDAINAASAGSTVLVAAGVYNSGGAVWEDSGLTNRVLINKPLTLRSVGGPDVTFIVGNSSTNVRQCGDSAARCLAIAAAPVYVSGFTLTNGHTRVSDFKKASSGGGVWTTNAGTVVIENCRITGCAAYEYGGGGLGGTYSNCVIRGNKAWEGGGLYAASNIACEIVENWAGGGGGGISESTSILSRIAFNKAEGAGGGVAWSTVDRCTIERNTGRYGGGVYGTLVQSSLILCNTGTAEGGGAMFSLLMNCTVVSNRAQENRGGIYGCKVTNSIVYYNSAPSNPNADSTSTGSANCIVLPPGVSWSATITNEPQFMARSFRLRGNSPCVDAGTNVPGLELAKDLDGRERVIYGNVDLGAFEYAAVVNDFDWDGKSDIAVWRSFGANNWGMWTGLSGGGTGHLETATSLAGALRPYPVQVGGSMVNAAYHATTWNWYTFPFASPLFQWGAPGMTPVYGDYNGDGNVDCAVYELASGKWYIRDPSRGGVLAWAKQWGYHGTWPVPGDYDGDGIWDLAVYDSTKGNWYILTLSNKILAWGVNWGFKGAVPVWGDYDGDGCFDLAVYDKGAGRWYIYSRKKAAVLTWNKQWGYKGAEPVPGDFNGDGVYDLAVMDVAASRWYVLTMNDALLRWDYYLRSGAAVHGIPW